MGPKHNRQIEKAITTLDKSASETILNEDNTLFFQFKKTERIVAALYILTGFLSDTEPLKRELREIGTVLIKRILSLRYNATTRAGVDEIARLITRLSSLLDLAHIADLLSSSHLFLLRQELQVLSEMLNNALRNNARASGPVFEKSFFEPKTAKDISQGHSSLHKDVRYATEKGGKRSRTEHRREHLAANGHFSAAMALQEGRRTKIVAVIRERGVSSIKDISAIFRDCGEKTLQRILARLVREGVLEKTGVKRWVRYSLKESGIL